MPCHAPPTPPGQRLELLRVDLDVSPREERDGVTTQDDRFLVTQCTAGEVCCLVKSWCGDLEVGFWPQRVDELFAVERTPGLQRQHLDQSSRLAPTPLGCVHSHAVDDDGEPTRGDVIRTSDVLTGPPIRA